MFLSLLKQLLLKRYPTDLHDKKREIIEPSLPLLLHEFPAWQTVYDYYNRRTKNKIWQDSRYFTSESSDAWATGKLIFGHLKHALRNS